MPAEPPDRAGSSHPGHLVVPGHNKRHYRIATLIAAVALAVAGHIAVPSGASAAQQSAALPVVNMEAVLKAAQWDPQKTGSGITRGSGPSVLHVEKALNAKGLLDSTYVDGHYGTSTVTAYTRWQRQLGYTGLGANGIPGESSLNPNPPTGL